jgi:hypothetical protein
VVVVVVAVAVVVELVVEVVVVGSGDWIHDGGPEHDVKE